MTPTTDQLKDLLAKVTQGDWYIDGGQVTSDALHEMDCIVYHVYGTEANATLIALAPTLAAEVVRLRESLTRIVSLTEEAPFDFGLIRLISRQGLDATSAK